MITGKAEKILFEANLAYDEHGIPVSANIPMGKWAVIKIRRRDVGQRPFVVMITSLPYRGGAKWWNMSMVGGIGRLCGQYGSFDAAWAAASLLAINASGVLLKTEGER